MKITLTILLLTILLDSCANKKTHLKTENSETIENQTLNFIDSYHEITLTQKGDKCGEWGGDTEVIRIYKTEYNGSFFADYKKVIIDCKDAFSENRKTKIIEKKEILVNAVALNLAEESISELVHYKLTTATKISHSGITNSVISKDSSLIIEHWPSFDWPKFRELINEIE